MSFSFAFCVVHNKKKTDQRKFKFSRNTVIVIKGLLLGYPNLGD